MPTPAHSPLRGACPVPVIRGPSTKYIHNQSVSYAAILDRIFYSSSHDCIQHSKRDFANSTLKMQCGQGTNIHKADIYSFIILHLYFVNRQFDPQPQSINNNKTQTQAISSNQVRRPAQLPACRYCLPSLHPLCNAMIDVNEYLLQQPNM